MRVFNISLTETFFIIGENLRHFPYFAIQNSVEIFEKEASGDVIIVPAETLAPGEVLMKSGVKLR